MSRPESILNRQDKKDLLQLQHPSRCSAIRQYLPLSRGWTAPEISEKEDSYDSHIYRWFLESLELPFISRGSARFNWYSCTVASLKVPAMLDLDVVTEVLDTEIFPQHNIDGLISSIAFVLFSQEALQWKEINIHTHKY